MSFNQLDNEKGDERTFALVSPLFARHVVALVKCLGGGAISRLEAVISKLVAVVRILPIVNPSRGSET